MPDRYNCPGSGFHLAFLASGRSRKGIAVGCQQSLGASSENSEIWPIPSSLLTAYSFQEPRPAVSTSVTVPRPIVEDLRVVSRTGG